MTTPGETEEGQSSDPHNHAISQPGDGILIVVVLLHEGFRLGPTTPGITRTVDARGTPVPRTDAMTRRIVVTPMTKPGRSRTVGTGRLLGTRRGIVGDGRRRRRRGRACHVPHGGPREIRHGCRNRGRGRHWGFVGVHDRSSSRRDGGDGEFCCLYRVTVDRRRC